MAEIIVEKEVKKEQPFFEVLPNRSRNIFECWRLAINRNFEKLAEWMRMKKVEESFDIYDKNFAYLEQRIEKLEEKLKAKK